MTLRETIRRWEPNYLHLIIALTLLQLFITLFTDGFALTFDEAIWHFIGRNWFRNGLVPFSGGIDNKSPLIFAIFGLSDKLFGVNYWFPRVLGAICQSIGLLYVYKIADRVAGKQAGILAISFYGLSLLWRSTGGKYTSYTETYEVMFVILAVYHYLNAQSKRGFLISGCMAGIGLGFRISAFFAIVAILISSLRKSKINTGFFCLGILASVGFLLLIGLLAGINLYDLFIYDFADNFNAGSSYDHSFLWKMEQLFDKFFYSEIILFYPLVIGYVIIKKRIDLFALWCIFAFVGINVIGEYTRLHIKEMLPALSLMSAFAVAHLVDTYHMPFKSIMLITWIVFFPKLLEPLINFKKVLLGKTASTEEPNKQPYTWPDEGTRKKIGWWVRDNTVAQEKVFVAGFGAQIQVYSERPSVYFNEMQTAMAKQMLFSDLNQNKAAMILVPLFPEYQQYIGTDERLFIDNLVAKNYYLYKCMYSYNIYKIKK